MVPFLLQDGSHGESEKVALVLYWKNDTKNANCEMSELRKKWKIREVESATKFARAARQSRCR